MANSRIPGPLGCLKHIGVPVGQIPGPLGQFIEMRSLDSPGPVGVNDWASFIATTRITNHSSKALASASTGTCACNRDITLDELCKIYSHRKRGQVEKFLPYLNSTFKAYDITTCLRKAHFLAQVGHESGELHYTAESLPKGKKEADVYDGYKGRGLIQITFSKNYKAYSNASKHDFLGNHRSDLEQPKWATDSAGWYWTSGSSKDLNTLADKNDLLAITARVNGAFNGFEDRRQLLAAAFVSLDVKGCKAANIGETPFKKFKDSECYSSRLNSFAWGAWNDPKTGKKGVSPQSVDERKAGYARYIELKAEMVAKNKKDQHNHYGFSPEKMDSLAAEGVK